MTVSTTSSTLSFAGGQSSLDFSFKVLPDHAEHVKLKAVLISSGAETELTYSSGYTVVLESDGVGGTITVSPTYSTSYRYVAYRETVNLQESDYEDYNQFPSDTLEEDLDRRTLVGQEKKEEVDRCLKIPLAGATFDAEIPYPVANRYLMINSGADGIALASNITTTTTGYSGTISAGNDADKAASPDQNDIYVATDTKIVYYCFTAGTWTPNTDIYIPTGSTLNIYASDSTQLFSIDESGNVKIKGVIEQGANF